jgi:hypothetical protein
MTHSEAGRDEAPSKVGFVTALDDQLYNAWQEHRWAAFLRAWLSAVVVITIVGFVSSLIMLGVYEAFTVIVFGSGKGLSQLLGLCAGIAAIGGGSVLFFTVPMMAVKANQ